MFSLAKATLTTLPILFLSACGLDFSNPNADKIAYLTDSAISGVTYTCGTTTGLTGSLGEFTYNNSCATIDFSIGKVKIGSINPADIDRDKYVFPTDILSLERIDTNSPDVVNALRILQSLDTDQNPYNGIVIDQQITDTLASLATDIDLTTEKDESELFEITDLVGKTLLPINDAVAHFEDSLRTLIGSTIDTVAPSQPIITTFENIVNKDTSTLTISGETDAVIVVNGSDYGTIGSSKTATITFDTSGSDGDRSFDVELRDGAGQTSTTATFTVLKDTIKPTFGSTVSFIVDENATTAGQMFATDANQSSIIYSIENQENSLFSINANTGVISFKQSPDFENSSTNNIYNLTVLATDLALNQNSKAISVSVSNLNDTAPVVTSNDVTVGENTTASPLTVTFTDADNLPSTFTYSIIGDDAEAFTIDSTTGIINFVTAPDFEAKSSYSIALVVNDGIQDSVSKTITISIDNYNDTAPVVTQTDVTVDENTTAVAFTIAKTDEDNLPSTFTYSISGTDSNDFIINSSTGDITFVSSPDFETRTSYSIDVGVNDGNQDAVSKTITISINNLNDIAPVISALDDVTIDENTTDSPFTVTSTDADNLPSTFTYSISGADAEAFTIDSTTGVINFVTAPDFEQKSSYSFDVSVSDGIQMSAGKTVLISVNNLNDTAPVVTSNDVTVGENTTTSPLTVTFTDADNLPSTFTYSIIGDDAEAFTIDSTTGIINFVTAPDFEAKSSYSIALVVNDGIQDSVSKTITISIDNYNDTAPVVTQTDVTVDENTTAVALTIAKTDEDNLPSTFTYSISGTDSNDFIINSSTGDITFVSSPDFETRTSYSIDVGVNDGNQDAVNKTITISINNLDDVIPVFISDSNLTINENSTSLLIDADFDPVFPAVFSINADLPQSLVGTSINSVTGEITLNYSPDYENPIADNGNIITLTLKVAGLSGFSVLDFIISINNLDDVPNPELIASNGLVSGAVTLNDAIINAKVYFQDRSGNLLETITDADGRYSIQTTPGINYAIYALLPDGEKLYSYTDGSMAIVNITPITSLVIDSLAYNSFNLNSHFFFLNYANLDLALLNSGLITAKALILTNQQLLNELTNYLLTGFDHFHNYYSATGFNYDRVLKAWDISIVNGRIVVRLEDIFLTTANIVVDDTLTKSTSGILKDASGNVISGATIEAYYFLNGIKIPFSTTTASDGSYTLLLPTYRTFNITYNYNGILTYLYNYNTFYTADILTLSLPNIFIPSTGLTDITGFIKNARTTDGIPDVELALREGLNNKSGSIVATTTTNSNGSYTFSQVPNVPYTIDILSVNEFDEDGTGSDSYYSTYSYSNNGANSDLDLFMVPDNRPEMLTNDGYLVAVLTWGDEPSDLDSHLWMKASSTDASQSHLSYSVNPTPITDAIGSIPEDSNNPCATSGTVASLDLDDTSAYGPETVTMCTFTGAATYQILHFSSGTIPNGTESQPSKVIVRSYNGDTFEFNPAPNTNSNSVWNVFTLDDSGEIIPVNNYQQGVGSLN